MARFLFFLLLVFGGIFFHWFFIVFFAAVFASFFVLPLELIFVGLFLDSLLYVSPPAVFTAGLTLTLIAEELLKPVVQKESRAIIIFCGLLSFGALYFIF